MKTAKEYESEIKVLKHAILEYPDSTSLTRKLSRPLTEWAKRLDIYITVASNEQTPWTEAELLYECKPMLTKEECGLAQVGDYHAFIKGYGCFVGLLAERKGVTRDKGYMTACDMYSTFANIAGRERFYAEIDRYRQDERFNQMVIIAECTYQEYLSFKPKFNGKQYNRSNYGMSVEARRATIAKLHAMQVPVIWAGTREQATKLYPQLIRQWCRQNFEMVVK